MKVNEVFDAYSAYYDLLYRDKDYAGEVDYVASLIEKYGPNSHSFLELGCGTGGHAEYFSRRGYKVHGIDISDSMLARASARRHKLPSDKAERLSFSQADVRNYRDGSHYDAVLALFHVFSYQVSNEDLEQVFTTAANHLPQGGLLVFDYWYGPAVLRQMPETRTRMIEDERCSVTRQAQPEVFPGENRVDVCYTIAIEDKTTGKEKIIKERHSMRYLFLPEIGLLCKAHFTVRQHYAWRTYRSPGFSDWSAVSVLERRR